MKVGIYLAIVMLLVQLCSCNIWDNVFSRLLTKHRIVLPEADEFEVAYRRRLSSYVVAVNFNRTSHLEVELNMQIGGVFRQPIFTAALDLKKRTLGVVVHSREKCTVVELPKTLEIAYGNQSYPLSTDSFKGLNVLVSVVTAFDHAEGNTFVYKLGRDLLSNRAERRLLQETLEDFTNLQQLKSLLSGSKGLLSGQRSQDPAAEGEATDSEEQPEDTQDTDLLGGLAGGLLEQNPIAFLRGVSSAQQAELRFVGPQLNQIDIGKQKFKIVRKKISIHKLVAEECSHENWSDKSSKQILDELQMLMYGH